jgi:hypothetical protein
MSVFITADSVNFFYKEVKLCKTEDSETSFFALVVPCFVWHENC